MDDVIVIGAGLAGLSAAMELIEKGLSVRIIEKESFVGGRTASWKDNGMVVESGLHRYIGVYSELPELIKKSGLNLNEIIQWENELEIRLSDGKSGVFGAAPIYKPLKTIFSWLGNSAIISLKDKYDLVRFIIKGIHFYKNTPQELDRYTVLEFANKLNISTKLIHNLLIPLTAGLFFIGPERYSACSFFGLFSFILPKWYKMGIAAFKGGMTEVMAEPILQSILKKGALCERNFKVTEILVDKNQLVGVKAGGKTLHSKTVILATSLGQAQKLLAPHFSEHPDFKPMLQLPSMPSVTFQMELTEPSMPIDRVTFSPGTSLASFSEQSRTTFPSTSGRLSIILTPPEKFLKMQPEEILAIVIEDMQKAGIKLNASMVKNYRKIAWEEDFYLFSPGNENLKPHQATSVFGLALAGDYTKQPYFSTMEGAVFSGKKAAEALLSQVRSFNT